MAWTKTYDQDEPQRINKWLAQSGVCSRREAEALIEKGQVSIDGQTVTEPGRKIATGETLTLNDAATHRLENAITAVLNKPVDYVSAQPEHGQIPAARLVTQDNLVGQSSAIPTRDTRLAPVGRLDMDSRGLLLLTEDGVLTKAIIGPASQSEKEYLVKVTGQITPQRISRLCHGIALDGRQLRPAKVTQEGPQDLRFILTEGRNRQIRRMCELVGLQVIDLFRIRIGNVRIGDLPEGKWRALTDKERDGLIRSGKGTDKGKPGSSAGRSQPHRKRRSETRSQR